MDKIPINDPIIVSLSRLVDDAQKERRDPSHSDIQNVIQSCQLSGGDPHNSGPPVGKLKRVRSVLYWGLENQPSDVEIFGYKLISLIKGCGGFRKASPNYVGEDSIKNLCDAFKSVNILFLEDGTITPITLENLSGQQLTEALQIYVDRAKRGIEDAALSVGTSKDLLEAVSAHILQELWGTYPRKDNFPTLLGQAFSALELSTPEHKEKSGEHPRCKVERAMYQLACSLNTLRNKQGSGHGRPWVPDLKNNEAKFAIESIGVISEYLLEKLKIKRA
ncbi:MAG: abortive infection family protein [Ignavibacteriae bacterium]|nr:hypothetical protein [Ignavibacteriota bacterium]NOH00213.1 abortive infection family protein [Ignavibacteriota bacterium]